MSTVIHNGYRLPSLSTLSDVMAWVNPLRQVLTAHALEELDARVVRRALALFDEDTARAHGRILEDSEDVPGSCVFRAIQGIREEVMEARASRRRCDLDPEVRLALIPDGPNLFGLLFSELPGIPGAFQKQMGVEEYSYSNQTDSTPDIAAPEWGARGVGWDRLLGPSGRPSDVSMEVVLVHKDLIHQLSGPSDDASLSVLSSPEHVRARAQRVALKTPAAGLTSELLSEYKRIKSLGVWVRHHMALMEGRVPAFNEEVDSLTRLLVPSPTLDQLGAAICAPGMAPGPG